MRRGRRLTPGADPARGTGAANSQHDESNGRDRGNANAGKTRRVRCFIILLDDAAIRIAATAPLTGRKLGPPTARLRTNGSISAAPMIAASPSRPPSPNFARTQPDASETTTKS